MPEDQSQLWDLLSLLAQLQKRALASFLVQELGNPNQYPPVLLGDIVHHSAIMSLAWQNVWNLRSIMGGLKSSIVSGLRRGGCGLGLLVGLLLLVIVLVHPRWLAMTEVLVREHVGSLREHVGGGGGGGGNGRVARGLVLCCLNVLNVVWEVVSGRCG